MDLLARLWVLGVLANAETERRLLDPEGGRNSDCVWCCCSYMGLPFRSDLYACERHSHERQLSEWNSKLVATMDSVAITWTVSAGLSDYPLTPHSAKDLSNDNEDIPWRSAAYFLGK